MIEVRELVKVFDTRGHIVRAVDNVSTTVAQVPGPATTLSMPESLTIATSTPSRNTSVMLHGRI